MYKMNRIKGLALAAMLMLTGTGLMAQTQKPKVTTTSVKASVTTKAEN